MSAPEYTADKWIESVQETVSKKSHPSAKFTDFTVPPKSDTIPGIYSVKHQNTPPEQAVSGS
jgi:hypothetical protein